MNPNKTVILAILDRSGSMAGIHGDMVGAMNNYFNEQKKLSGECDVFIVQFDTAIEDVVWNKPIKDVPTFNTREHFVPRGGTSLLDAMGYGINKLGEHLSKLHENDRPGRVLVVAYTDGGENSSHEYTNDQIKNMVKHQTETYSWDIVFMASNIDAFSTAQSFGISLNKTLNVAQNSKGYAGMVGALNNYTTQYRCAATPDAAVATSFTEEDREAAK